MSNPPPPSTSSFFGRRVFLSITVVAGLFAAGIFVYRAGLHVGQQGAAKDVTAVINQMSQIQAQFIQQVEPNHPQSAQIARQLANDTPIKNFSFQDANPAANKRSLERIATYRDFFKDAFIKIQLTSLAINDAKRLSNESVVNTLRLQSAISNDVTSARPDPSATGLSNPKDLSFYATYPQTAEDLVKAAERNRLVTGILIDQINALRAGKKPTTQPIELELK